MTGKSAHPTVAILTVLLLWQTAAAFGADAIDPRTEVQGHPGDIDAAIVRLGEMLQKNYPANIFAEFTARRVARPNDSAHYAAKRILSLQRMGKASVHSAAVKRAFTYEFLTTYGNNTRLHEALELYERIAVANTDDPFWRLIRARCSRLMDLPETIELYEQVAADMTGVPPDDDVRKLWEANREEFDLPPYTKEQWRRQTTTLVYDAKGLDVPGSPPIEGSPFPLLDIADAVGSKARAWTEALEGSPSTQAKALDELASQAEKYDALPWLDGRGFLDTERALTSHLLTKPAEELAELRTLQEKKVGRALLPGRMGTPARHQPSTHSSTGKSAHPTGATGKSAHPTEEKVLALFRRYPWSESAQRLLLQSAQRQVFQGETQAAFRGFQDVLRHAKARDLREQAQVGLWLSLAQFAEPARLAQSFEGVDPEATWPWYGKREKTDTIKQKLVGRALLPVTDKTGRSAHPTEKGSAHPTETQSPTLASLRPRIVRLPPAPIGFQQTVLSVDMQRDGNHLLVSNPMMLAMYSAANPTKPLWVQTRRRFRETGATYVLPRFVGQQVITSWGGDSVGDYHVVALNRADGTVVSDGDPHEPYARVLYRLTGSPAIADNKVFMAQVAQTHKLHTWLHQYTTYSDVALSCFGAEGMEHLWTRTYDADRTTGVPRTKYNIGIRPVVSEGAAYFVANSGHVIRADCRDGQMEWIHFFRPVIGQPPSPWCLGAATVVTEDKVICMPKFTGRLFALDKETGRRVWDLPLLRGHEVLGRHEDQLLVVGANTLFAIDIDTGEMRWGRQISEEYIDGFQLPRAQLIGSSIYCGTKKTLYRFDASNGARLESRDWGMGNETPMSFLIAGTDLYAISDLPLKDEIRERQLAKYHTVIHPAGAHRGLLKPVERKDGSVVFWRDGMLICVKGNKLLWSRFVSFSNDNAFICGMAGTVNGIRLGWPKGSAIHDATTGKMMRMGTIQMRKK